MARNSANGLSSRSGCADLAGIDSELQRVPAQDLVLTDDERSLLADPAWMDEDDADLIMAMRIEAEESGGAIPIRQYVRGGCLNTTYRGQFRDDLVAASLKRRENPGLYRCPLA